MGDRAEIDSPGVAFGLLLKSKPGLFSAFYFDDVSPLDGSRVSILHMMDQRFENWSALYELSPAIFLRD